MKEQLTTFAVAVVVVYFFYGILRSLFFTTGVVVMVGVTVWSLNKLK